MLSKAKWMRYQEPIKISLCDGCAHSRYRGKASVQYSPRFSTSSTAVRRSPFPSEGKAYGNSAYPPSRGRLKKVLHLRKSARNFVAGASRPLTREGDFCAAKRRRERNILRAFGLVIILSLPQSRWRSTAPSSEGAGWAFYNEGTQPVILSVARNLFLLLSARSFFGRAAPKNDIGGNVYTTFFPVENTCEVPLFCCAKARLPMVIGSRAVLYI